MADHINGLWKLMAETFGAKSLEAKYGATAPDAWRSEINRLSEFDVARGVRRMVRGGKPHIPTLPEFLRMCRELGGEDWLSADARPIPPSHQIEREPLPRWMETANKRLLQYIGARASQRIYYATQDLIQPLIEAKNAWCSDMGEAEQGEGLPPDNGRAWWNDYMQAAEIAVARVREAARAAAA